MILDTHHERVIYSINFHTPSFSTSRYNCSLFCFFIYRSRFPFFLTFSCALLIVAFPLSSPPLVEQQNGRGRSKRSNSPFVLRRFHGVRHGNGLLGPPSVIPNAHKKSALYNRDTCYRFNWTAVYLAGFIPRSSRSCPSMPRQRRSWELLRVFRGLQASNSSFLAVRRRTPWRDILRAERIQG